MEETENNINSTFDYISHTPPPTIIIVLNIVLLKVACVEQAYLAVEARIFGGSYRIKSEYCKDIIF